MATEWIRPSVNVSYDVRLSTKYALEYSNLNLKYVEEQVRAGQRGYTVIAKSGLQNFKTADFFGAMNIDVHQGQRQYMLEVRLSSSCTPISDIGGYKALPYGCLPVKIDEVNDAKRKEALSRHLLRRLVNNFEVDAIRAVIGNFTSTELKNNEEAIINNLIERWRPLECRSDESCAMSHKEVLILSSPTIRRTLQAVAEGISGRMVRSGGGMVFPEGDVADRVAAVFNAPMATIQVKNP